MNQSFTMQYVCRRLSYYTQYILCQRYPPTTRGSHQCLNMSQNNNMELDENKFEYLSHKLKRCLLDNLPFSKEFLSYTTAQGQELEPIEEARDLGVHISSDLSWTKHIGMMVNKARQSLSWALSVFFDRSASTMVHLYKSFTRSKM